jgi:hypothetical protein
MDHLLFPSLILAKILAAHGWQIPAPKNWLANFGRVDVGAIQTSPKYHLVLVVIHICDISESFHNGTVVQDMLRL